ncbi:hypothetical protein EJB05_44844, partial [Eragrostis curvula]
MAPAFRFLMAEVAEMEEIANQLNSNAATPDRAVVQALADKFNASAARAGRNIAVQPGQVLTWFKNRRRRNYPVCRPPTAPSEAATQGQAGALVGQPSPAAQDTAGSSSGDVAGWKNHMESGQVKFEVKSARDGAWYDVAAFLSQRGMETGDLEVKVRISGFGAEEDEWVKVRTCVRERSLPCQDTECACVLHGDLVLCFKESNTQALYFDANVTGIQRRRHDSRGCRCRFLVRYDHDQSEEIVRLRQLCRRPETEYRIQALHAARGDHAVP